MTAVFAYDRGGATQAAHKALFWAFKRTETDG